MLVGGDSDHVGVGTLSLPQDNPGWCPWAALGDSVPDGFRLRARGFPSSSLWLPDDGLRKEDPPELWRGGWGVGVGIAFLSHLQEAAFRKAN